MMHSSSNFPFFYSADISQAGLISLDADTSRHIAQVLRMKPGARIQLTDGCGSLALAEIIDNNKSHCTVSVVELKRMPARPRRLTMAVSMLKQPARFEWFLEKATEVGVEEIIPLICTRTEKQQFREERWKGILISAMLQSRQAWLPRLHAPLHLAEVVEKWASPFRLIAYCGEDVSRTDLPENSTEDVIMLIGPEGDFTREEVQRAIANQYRPVSLGDNRLRTETAALYSCILLNQ